MDLSTQTILLVEDEEDDVFFMRRALADAGISNPLHVATDGQEAIDYLTGEREFGDRERYPLPGMVFLDLKLPGKSGHDVLEAIRENPATSTLLVIVFTSSAEPRDIRRAYQLGARSFLVKPSLPTRYKEVLTAVKFYWFEFNLAAPPP